MTFLVFLLSFLISLDVYTDRKDKLQQFTQRKSAELSSKLNMSWWKLHFTWSLWWAYRVEITTLYVGLNNASCCMHVTLVRSWKHDFNGVDDIRIQYTQALYSLIMELSEFRCVKIMTLHVVNELVCTFIIWT